MSPRDLANEGFTLFLHRMPLGKATEVAKEMKVSDGDISTIKTKEMERCLTLLAYLNLKVVDAGNKSLTPVTFDFLTQTLERLARDNPGLLWGQQERGVHE